MILPRALPPSGVRLRFSDILAGLRAAWQGAGAVRFFEEEIRQYFNVRHVFLASSGRAALSVLLSALKQQYPDKNEVVLPAYTSFSVPSAVVNAGLKVALYDLDAETLSPNLASLRNSLSAQTLCIVVCHLYGYPCDMDAIKAIAAARGIPVIDDAAQAMGAMYKGRQVGTLGTAGLFSLSRGKNITAVDGGIIVTDDDRLAATLTQISLQQPQVTDTLIMLIKAVVLAVLLFPRVYWLPRSLPFLNIGASVFEPDFVIKTLLPFQAGIAREMLKRLSGINRNRQATAKALLDILREKGKKVFLPIVGAQPVYLRLPVLSAGDQPVESPALGVVKSYPAALDEVVELQPHLVPTGKNPVARNLAEHIVTLPTHEFVTEIDQGKIASFL